MIINTITTLESNVNRKILKDLVLKLKFYPSMTIEDIYYIIIMTMIVIVIITLIINVNRFVNLDAAGANMWCNTEDKKSNSEAEVSDDDQKKKDRIVSGTVYDSGFLIPCTSV